MTKKLLSLLFAVFFGVLSLGAAVLLTLFIAEYQKGGPDGTVLLGLSAMAVFIIAVCAAIVQASNRTYDEAEGYRNSNVKICRWTGTMLFGDLLMMFMTALLMVMTNDKGSILYPEKLSVLMFAAAAAVTIYVFHMSKYTRRRKRISQLKQRDSLCYGRRFHFTVWHLISPGVYEGYVQGKILVNDSVWVNAALWNTSEPVAAKIERIWVNDKETHSAKEQKARILVDCSIRLPDYTVLSSHHPKYQTQPEVIAENPRLSGMIASYKDCFLDGDYDSLLNYDLVHGKYLVAASVNDKRPSGTDMMDPIADRASVSFYSVSMKANMEDPVLPVFTDWDALGRYGYAVEDPSSAVFLMEYEKCIEVMRQGYAGIVIDPFGPSAFYLTKEFAESLLRMKAKEKEKQNEQTV